MNLKSRVAKIKKMLKVDKKYEFTTADWTQEESERRIMEFPNEQLEEKWRKTHWGPPRKLENFL